MLETVRYCCGGYLLWLAFKSLRSAMVPSAGKIADILAPRGHSTAGLALHITNPIPILFSTLFSIGLPAGTSASELVILVIIIGLNNAAIFFTFAFLFFKGAIVRAFAQARRWFGGVFANLFGLAGVQMLTMNPTP